MYIIETKFYKTIITLTIENNCDIVCPILWILRFDFITH